MSLGATSSWLRTVRRLFELAYGDQIVLEYESCRMQGGTPAGQRAPGADGAGGLTTGAAS